ncbi:MAG: hypothetical protein KC432_09190 [Thermomicrobiales bacterium]|nr:hypothetical protein [Thermomicrobiales bacterium]
MAALHRQPLTAQEPLQHWLPVVQSAWNCPQVGGGAQTPPLHSSPGVLQETPAQQSAWQTPVGHLISPAQQAAPEGGVAPSGLQHVPASHTSAPAQGVHAPPAEPQAVASST